MVGYMLEFKRNHTPASSDESYCPLPNRPGRLDAYRRLPGRGQREQELESEG